MFLSNRICQDPLENFFALQRQRGRDSENPSVAEFLRNTQSLRVIENTCRNVCGNCRDGTIISDSLKEAGPFPSTPERTQPKVCEVVKIDQIMSFMKDAQINAFDKVHSCMSSFFYNGISYCCQSCVGSLCQMLTDFCIY